MLSVILGVYGILVIIFGLIIAALTYTHNDFYYETYGLKVYYEQIKACIDECFNFPCNIHDFKNFTIFGEIIFGIAWILLIPSFIIGIILAFIVWSLRWLLVILCYKNGDEE